MGLAHVNAWRYSLSSIVVGVSIAAAVLGQEYPTRPIRIVTGGVGGGSDFTARLVAQGISGSLGQQVVVDNRGAGVVPGQIVSQAPGDGYTLLVAAGTLWIGPLLRKTPYDPLKDFSPVAAVAKSPSFLVVHPSLPVKSVKDLIALAKAHPGQLNYGSGTTAGADHLAAELFKAMAGVNIVRVAYKNAATQMTDLIGGQVDLSFATGGTAMNYVKAGRLRALAVTSGQRSALFPDLPTVATTVPGYEALQILGVWAPAKTPPTIIARLNQEIDRALARPDMKEKFLNSGVETVGGSPEQFAAIIQSDLSKMTKVIRDAGISDD